MSMPICWLFSSVCSDTEFTCDDGSCIRDDYVCNLYNDCTNGEDEWNCTPITITTTIQTDEPDEQGDSGFCCCRLTMKRNHMSLFLYCLLCADLSRQNTWTFLRIGELKGYMHYWFLKSNHLFPSDNQFRAGVFLAILP